MSKPTIRDINTYLQNPSTRQHVDGLTYQPASTNATEVVKEENTDDLIACIREMEIELGEPEGAIDVYWGMVDLQVWLRGLEQLQDKGRRHPVPLTKQELAYYAMSELL